MSRAGFSIYSILVGVVFGLVGYFTNVGMWYTAAAISVAVGVATPLVPR